MSWILFKLIAIIIFSERLLFNTSLPVYFILCPSRSVTDPNTHTHTHSDLAPNYLPHKRLLITSIKQLFSRLEITSFFLFFPANAADMISPCLWWMMLQSSRAALPSANSCNTRLRKGVSSPLGWPLAQKTSILNSKCFALVVAHRTDRGHFAAILLLLVFEKSGSLERILRPFTEWVFLTDIFIA